jgi:hypothetical protein
MGIEDAGDAFWNDEEEEVYDPYSDVTLEEEDDYDPYGDTTLLDEGDDLLDDDTAATDWDLDNNYVEQDTSDGDVFILPEDYYEDEFWETDVYDKAEDPDWDWSDALNRDFSDQDTDKFLAYMGEEEDEGVMAFLKGVVNNKGLMNILVSAGLGALSIISSDRKEAPVSKKSGGSGGRATPDPVSALGGQMGKVVKRGDN